MATKSQEPDYRNYNTEEHLNPYTASTPKGGFSLIQQGHRVAAIGGSDQWDQFLERVYLALPQFPEICRLLYNNSITIGNVLAPETISMLVKTTVNQLYLQREISCLSDFLCFQSSIVLDNPTTFVYTVANSAVIFRTNFDNKDYAFLSDVFTDYTYSDRQSFVNMMENNVWLVSVYVLCYVIQFIAQGKITEIIASSNVTKTQI